MFYFENQCGGGGGGDLFCTYVPRNGWMGGKGMQIAGTGNKETPHWTDVRRGLFLWDTGCERTGGGVCCPVPRDLFLLTAHTGDLFLKKIRFTIIIIIIITIIIQYIFICGEHTHTHTYIYIYTQRLWKFGLCAVPGRKEGKGREGVELYVCLRQM